MKIYFKKTFLLVSAIFIGFLMFVFSLPYIAKVRYVNTQELNDLYFLCKTSAFCNNDAFILEYVPQLIHEDEKHDIIDSLKMDEVLSQYLDSVLELEDFNEQKNALREAFLCFSGFETAIPQTTSFIVSYYDMTGNINEAKKFFEILLEASENRDFEYKNGVYTKYVAFLLDVGDYKGVERIREERIAFLKAEGIDIWNEDNQSEYLGVGATIN